MDHDTKRKADRRPLKDYHSGQEVTIHEIQDVMADEGYSASQRKGWLKTVLTELEQGEADTLSQERRDLINSIKDIVDDHQDGESSAKKAN